MVLALCSWETLMHWLSLESWPGSVLEHAAYLNFLAVPAFQSASFPMTGITLSPNECVDRRGN